MTGATVSTRYSFYDYVRGFTFFSLYGLVEYLPRPVGDVARARTRGREVESSTTPYSVESMSPSSQSPASATSILGAGRRSLTRAG